ncbi:uncharacterized protein IWZ02DRAFT_505393 [Phyllosticta citriasiana]|uniref:uncharacterized protein n=1 Tax=Phyllosticta citriasiana TaxID=595635 RepID=UPI0030FDEF71
MKMAADDVGQSPTQSGGMPPMGLRPAGEASSTASHRSHPTARWRYASKQLFCQSQRGSTLMHHSKMAHAQGPASLSHPRPSLACCNFQRSPHCSQSASLRPFHALLPLRRTQCAHDPQTCGCWLQQHVPGRGEYPAECVVGQGEAHHRVHGERCLEEKRRPTCCLGAVGRRGGKSFPRRAGLGPQGSSGPPRLSTRQLSSHDACSIQKSREWAMPILSQRIHRRGQVRARRFGCGSFSGVCDLHAYVRH